MFTFWFDKKFTLKVNLRSTNKKKRSKVEFVLCTNQHGPDKKKAKLKCSIYIYFCACVYFSIKEVRIRQCIIETPKVHKKTISEELFIYHPKCWCWRCECDNIFDLKINCCAVWGFSAPQFGVNALCTKKVNAFPNPIIRYFDELFKGQGKSALF